MLHQRRDFGAASRYAARLLGRDGNGNSPGRRRLRDRSGLLRNPVPAGRRGVMAKNRDKLAALLGAKIVGEVPDIGGGAFGMARLAHFLHQRLTPSQGERPGRPTNPNWVIRPKVPMSEATAEKLAPLAATLSTAQRKGSPMQVAAPQFEEA